MRNFFQGRWARAAGAVLVAAGVMTAVVGASVPASGLDADTPVVTLEDGTNGCNGVRPTPGSENTSKRLDPAFASNFDPGGIVGYIIDYPVDASDVAGRTTFVITDCVFVNGQAVAKYSVSFVPNTTEFELRFAVPIAPDTPLGAQFCNYAKTTAAPSESQASNRKAGPACFTVGGSLRVEKRSGSTTGPLLPGAAFSVVCTPAEGATQPTIITGLSQASHANDDGTVSAAGTSATGSIAITGPSGTPCTVTETAAPPGYVLDPTPRNLTIPVGAAQQVSVFVNVQLGDLVITKSTSGGTGTFTFDVNCDGTTWDQAKTITGSGSATVTGIPVGTHCTVTERDDPWFSGFSVPADGAVVIAPGDNTVSFVNTRDTGSLVISKTTSGGTGTFTFDVNCDGTAFDTTVTITDTGTRTITGIPTGTSCTVTERPNADFTSTSDPADGTVVIATGTNTVAFTNARNVGNLLVTKTVNGGTGTFTFDVDCTGTAFDRTLTITGSGNQTISGIPTGSTCTVTERANPLFSPVVVPANGTVTIGPGTNTVAFTNTRNTGSLVVTKITTGGSGTFVFDVDCDGTAFDTTVTITDSGSQTLSGIPTTTSCTVSERPDARFSSTRLPADGKVTIGAAPVTVAFANAARPTSISVDKKVNGGDHATLAAALAVHKGDALDYTVVVRNTGDVALTVAALTDSLRAAVADTCTQGIGSSIAPGASFTCAYRSTATASVTNVVTVAGVDGLGRRSEASDATFVKVINPAIAIVKTASAASVPVGADVTFTYAVTNTGDTALHDVAVADDVLGSIGPIGDLAPGATVTLAKAQTVTGTTPTRNVGTVTGTDQLGLKVSASDAEEIAVVLGLVIEQLPRTGGPINVLSTAGLALVAAGVVVLLAGRRRREA